MNDCGDNSDEQNCVATEVTTALDEVTNNKVTLSDHTTSAMRNNSIFNSTSSVGPMQNYNVPRKIFLVVTACKYY